ncbi:MAG: hypothetical protein WAM73_16550 [Desulfobacterales bacterium]
MPKKTTAGPPYTGEAESDPRMDKTGHDRSPDDIRSKMAEHLKSRLSERIVLSGAKLRKTAKALKNTGNCFIEEDQGFIGEYVTTAADRIEHFSTYLQDTPLEQLKEDARQLSHKKPWLFMGACFSTGILLARVIKAAQSRG